MDEELIGRLVKEAKELAAETESAREALLSAARRRQEAILALKAAGLSVRGIAARLGTSPSVIQTSLATAIARHPATARREERFPYELHVLLAAKFHEQPERLRSIAKSNIQKMRETPRAAIAEGWLNRWEEILELSVDEIEQEMLKDTDEGRDMRQISPFAGALDNTERMVAMKKAQLLAAR
ncbi:helix-turn-helix domain-containing protein [Pseudarthrobacter sp. BIM B-2242]|uniref:helix-turn-helix domain-containing protein n=1 Tax=Pseudarthrobacter sp. BIM B-2242 TaxID=2772401 RepID=UPI00168B822B|nr:helix-turn-helix domain-containing protein [Pseudarthrobacter sp. BIM B-2242]QOD05903.1 helix-turn-helix domain-containing protein [Pseudarthrobacter sp. BIM B-2242]